MYAQLRGIGICVTDRYQDVRDTSPSVSGLERDRAGSLRITWYSIASAPTF